MTVKTILLTTLASLIAIPAAMATPSACQVGTMASYIGSSCTINGLMFDTFTDNNTASPSGNAIPTSSITVTPITIAGDEGFMFSFGSSVVTQAGGVSSYQDELIGFHISTISGLATIHDLTLYFNGGFTGTGSSSVTENYCIGHTLLGCPSGSSGQIHVTNPPPSFNDEILLGGGASSLYVSKDMNATSGTNGTANISQVANQYAVPEPFSMMLLGGGLVGLGVMRRFRRS
jgi:hypothetical protein